MANLQPFDESFGISCCHSSDGVFLPGLGPASGGAFFVRQFSELEALFAARKLLGHTRVPIARKPYGFREKITILSNKLQCVLKLFNRGVGRLAERRPARMGIGLVERRRPRQQQACPRVASARTSSAPAQVHSCPLWSRLRAPSAWSEPGFVWVRLQANRSASFARYQHLTPSRGDRSRHEYR